MKPVVFVGASREALKAFPPAARREAGLQLLRVQHGLLPSDWKPMRGVGAGVQEIRGRESSGAFRVIYVARFASAVYVLHCFQKKTAATGKPDIDLAAARYRLIKERT